MATAGEMTKIVAEAFSLPEAVVFNYQTMLRKAGLITIGGRGRSAPQMTSLDIARLIIALMGADALAEAVAIVELFGSLDCITVIKDTMPSGPDDLVHDIMAPYSFESALAELIQATSKRRQGKYRSANLFGLALDAHEISVSLRPSSLEASICIGPFDVQYRRLSEPANPSPPDQWGNLPIMDRLIARAAFPGISTLRSIGYIELYVACGAVFEHPEKWPHH